MGRPPNLTSAAFACPIGAERVSRVTRSSCPINPGAVMTWCSAADFWPWVRRILTIPSAEECALMLKKDQSRTKYPSDRTDAQWAIVAPLLPPAKQSPRGGHPREGDRREVLKTIFSLNRRGCPWDRLPHD